MLPIKAQYIQEKVGLPNSPFVREPVPLIAALSSCIPRFLNFSIPLPTYMVFCLNVNRMTPGSDTQSFNPSPCCYHHTSWKHPSLYPAPNTSFIPITKRESTNRIFYFEIQSGILGGIIDIPVQSLIWSRALPVAMILLSSHTGRARLSSLKLDLHLFIYFEIHKREDPPMVKNLVFNNKSKFCSMGRSKEACSLRL